VSPRPLKRARRVYAKIRRDLLTASPVRLFRYGRTLTRIMRVSRGEFYVPRPGGEDWRLYGDLQNVAHLLRYEWAETVLRERGAKHILDVACGAGYGSHRLAGFASEVLGVDANPGAIAYARKHYPHPAIRHEHARMEELPGRLGSSRFDAIVSFDTIEHAEGEQWLDVFAGLLEPDGALLLSTPIAPVTTRTPENPHHTIEYSTEDLRSLLSTRFETVLDGESMPGYARFAAASARFSGRRFHAGMSPCVCTGIISG